MSARDLMGMEVLKARLVGRGSGYSAAGSKELARLAHKAAFALEDAIRAITEFDDAEGDAIQQAKEA